MVFLHPSDADVQLQTPAFGETLPRKLQVARKARGRGERSPGGAEVGSELDGTPLRSNRVGVAARDQMAQTFDRQIRGLGEVARAQSWTTGRQSMNAQVTG
jgi:hypothetical protein